MASNDEELAEQLAREREEARRKEVDDVKWLMAHRPGRRIAWRLLERAGVYRTSFNNSGSVTAFNEGQRNVGLFLLAEIQENSPEQYLAMLKERTE